MTTPDFPALCAELADELHGYASANPHHDSDELVARARAALAAKPEPEGPTDEEILEWAISSDSPVPEECLDPDMGGWQRCFTSEEFCATVRGVLDRWGHS